MRCPHCKGKLLQRSGDTTRVRITGTVEIDDATGGCRAQCYWCKQPVAVPLRLVPSGPVEEERFLLQEPPDKVPAK